MFGASHFLPPFSGGAPPDARRLEGAFLSAVGLGGGWHIAL